MERKIASSGSSKAMGRHPEEGIVLSNPVGAPSNNMGKRVMSLLFMIFESEVVMDKCIGRSGRIDQSGIMPWLGIKMYKLFLNGSRSY